MTHTDVRAGAAELLSLQETAAALRTPVATLRYWRHLGVGPDGFRLGRRVVYRRQSPMILAPRGLLHLSG